MTVSFRSGRIPQRSSVLRCPSAATNSFLYPTSSGFFLQCLWISAFVYSDCICPRINVNRVAAWGDAGDPFSQHDRATSGSSVLGWSPLMVDQLDPALLCWLSCLPMRCSWWLVGVSSFMREVSVPAPCGQSKSQHRTIEISHKQTHKTDSIRQMKLKS